jgi:hypothetical protein
LVNILLKWFRERDILLDKELIDYFGSIEDLISSFNEPPVNESVEEHIERIMRDREIPNPYYITDKGIVYYYKHHSERLEKIVSLVIFYILSTIAISVVSILK